MVSMALLAGCGQETEAASGIRQINDPAMQAPPAIDAPSEAAGSQSSADDDSTPSPDPDQSFVDLDARRVYMHGTGWVAGDAFLDLYLNRPAELPGDIDLEAIHKLVGALSVNES
jgi:hypothetical protein